MASTHETHQTVDPTGDLDYYRNRVHQLEAQIVAVRAVVHVGDPDWRRRCETAADALRDLLALPDTRLGAWETRYVGALNEPLRDILAELTGAGAS